MSIERVLVIDDDVLMRDFIADALHKKHIEATSVKSGQQALELLNQGCFDLVITDVKLQDAPGLDILRKVKELNPNTLVVIVAAFGNAESIAEAMHLGAFTYLLKPFSVEALDAVIEKAREHIVLVEENKYLRHQVSTKGSHALPKVIGESPLMKQILTDAMQVAKSNASVLISGESGTGKEVIAHTIHYNSSRAQRPFIRVNCAAMAETLIESEFFGHEKGSFTGANAKRLGRFELAHGGSLLLDEVTEIPLSLQAKLLRAVQEQEFERIGGAKTVKVDVRFISTSNRNIKEAVANKALREDLYYRLNVVPIHIPPLRDRREDIIPLAEYFLEKLCVDNNKPQKKMTENARKKLLEYPWPGNIRELANIIERAVVLDSSMHLSGEQFHLDAASTMESPSIIPVGMTLQELEKRLITQTLQHHQNNRTKTAEVLGISPTTLRKKIQSYQLS